MPGLSERMSKVEGILEQMSDRLNHIETRLGRIESRMDHMKSKMGSEFAAIRAEMSTQFRWTLASIMGMWVTVIMAVLFK